MCPLVLFDLVGLLLKNGVDDSLPKATLSWFLRYPPSWLSFPTIPAQFLLWLSSPAPTLVQMVALSWVQFMDAVLGCWSQS